jgi:glycosyltransferase involved in cell wall biosynthesis
VDRETVLHHLARAKALIFPGVEDFGIVPLEALAAGTPVIAFKEGGVLETLNNDVALFFTEATGESLTQAILNFKAENFPREKLFQRAQEFSKENFKMKISNLIKGM